MKWSGLPESREIGAMKRGAGSPGSREYDVSSASDCAPGLSAQLLVILTARLVYSCNWLQPWRGSAAPSPPSPPKFDPISVSPLVPFGATLRRLETPLSCRPPETTTPVPDGSLPTDEE